MADAHREIPSQLRAFHERLRLCTKCPAMMGRAVYGAAVNSPIMILGQAPGLHEEGLGRPFAHKAGKTLFKWLEGATGIAEDEMRELVYFSAVNRCFPGKSPTGQGDRVASDEEIRNCAVHLRSEIRILQPKLVLAVGKVAIAEVFAASGLNPLRLANVVGKKLRATFMDFDVEVIALPHPSGVSRWPHTAEGKRKLGRALKLVGEEFRKLV